MSDIYSTVRGGYRAARGLKKSPQDKLLSRPEILSLLRAAKSDRGPHGAPAWALFVFAVNFGLRSKEVVVLRRDEDFQSLKLGYFRVRTAKKRGVQEDRIYVDSRHAALVSEALAAVKSRGQLLFPFTTRTVRYIFAYYAEKAGLSPNVSFHALRHTAAKEVLDAASALPILAPKAMNIVSAFLRHKPTTTQVYTYPTAEEMIFTMQEKEVLR